MQTAGTKPTGGADAASPALAVPQDASSAAANAMQVLPSPAPPPTVLPAAARAAGPGAPAAGDATLRQARPTLAAADLGDGQAGLLLPAAAEAKLPGAALPPAAIDAQTAIGQPAIGRPLASEGVLAASVQAGVAPAAPDGTRPAHGASAPPSAPSPAQQIEPALVQLSRGPSGASVTVRLDPGGLGHVQIRIERDAAGGATVQVTAERAETLRMLMGDQPHLHQALDHAGLAADGRTLTFDLSTGSDAFTSANGTSANGAPANGASGNGASGSGTPGNDTHGGGRPGGGRTSRADGSLNGQDDEAGLAIMSAWQRAGVNITA